MSNNLVVNAAIATIERARHDAARRAFGTMSGDMKREHAWCEYGFPEHITTAMFKKMYNRVPLAFAGVDKTIKKCWSSNPWIESENKYFEEQVNKILDAEFWALFAEADRRRLAGRFSAIVLRYREGTVAGRPYSYSDAVDKKQRSLHTILPIWSTALKPTEFYAEGEKISLPSKWQYQPEGYGGQKAPAYQINDERMFILGDISDGGYAFLEAAYNDLINIEKITGGTGESFLKNASRQVHIDFDKEIDVASSAKAAGVDPKDLKKELDKSMRNMNQGNDSALITQGAKSSMLVSAIADPEPPYLVTVQNIAASFNMPTKILTGSQSGERASVEDYKEWNDTCQARRVTVLNREIELFIRERLIAHGVVAAADEFKVCWDNLGEDGALDKLTLADKMADINQKQAVIGDQLPFTSKRIAEVAGEDVEDGDWYL